METLAILLAFSLVVHVRAAFLPKPAQFFLSSDDNAGSTAKESPEPQNEKDLPKKIAIIGSGITGAVTAFTLSEGYRSKVPPDQRPAITVFERNSIVGGRITQSYAFNDPRFPVDTCVATFSIQDGCIAQQVTNVGLVTELLTIMRPVAGTGVWDGEKLVGFVEENGFRNPVGFSPFKTAKWYERYSSTPWDFAQNVTDIRLKFDMLLPVTAGAPGDQPVDPGRTNLSKELEMTGLQDYDQNLFCFDRHLDYPDEEKAGKFANEVIYSGLRERFFDDVFGFNALSFYLGFESESPSSVRGGNLQLIERLLKLSTLDVRTATEVQKIERQGGNNIQITAVPVSGGEPSVEQFDRLIIASSLELGNLTFEPPLEDLPGLEQDYSDSFIIHFTTASKLNATYFNQTGTMPQNLLTTYYAEEDKDIRPSFFSLTLIGQVTNPDEPSRVENLYKLVSREEIPYNEIEKYLTEPEECCRPVISWIDTEAQPKSVPIAAGGLDGGCRTTLEKFEIAPGIYYAGGGEQVIASAEMGCRFGANSANLVLNGGDTR